MTTFTVLSVTAPSMYCTVLLVLLPGQRTGRYAQRTWLHTVLLVQMVKAYLHSAGHWVSQLGLTLQQ